MVYMRPVTSILLINGHQPFPTSPGKLNQAFCDRAQTHFEADGATDTDTVSGVLECERWERDNAYE